jgi:iron(III) transport system substrate-binding protein
MVYNPAMVEKLPSSVLDLTEPAWQGRIGIAPGNASFQSFVTALRVLEGEQVAADWLTGIKRNAVIYEKNGAILEAVESGQLAAGLINHYYWYAMAAEKGQDSMHSALASFEPADSGNLTNVSGVAVLSDNPAALKFAEFLLSESSQKYFAEQESEFPLRLGVQLSGELISLADWPAPKVDLSDLDTLEKTLEMIRAAGLL